MTQNAAASHPFTPPEIDYLSRDFASLRQVMLDHLATLAPQWQEDNLADLGHVLLDILAHAGDQLSYFQDAVATEAYLGTARRRESVRRHARLLDYFLHEGCNARVLVHVNVSQEATLPPGTLFLTAANSSPVIALDSAVYRQALAQKAHVFESMQPVHLYPAHNEIPFFVPDDELPWLPTGATSARLHNDPPLYLQVGEFLLFQEIANRATGDPLTADPTRCHAVRLTRILAYAHQGRAVLEIGWDSADAPPFDLVLERRRGQSQPQPISVARGNLALADDGRTTTVTLPTVLPDQRYLPRLTAQPLIYAEPLPAEPRPLSLLLRQNPRRALPTVQLWQRHHVANAQPAQGRCLPLPDGGMLIFDAVEQEMVWAENGRFHHTLPWQVRRELLNSGPFARDFVVEIANSGEARLRFGFGDVGWQPQPGDQFTAVFRIGNRGNIGPDAINHIVLPKGDPAGAAVRRVSNPLPAVGGQVREPQETARLLAPASLGGQLRCVTAEDYAAQMLQHPEVAEAQARLVPGPLWQTAVISVRRRHLPFDNQFRQELADFIRPYLLVGADVEIREPEIISVYLALTVTPRPGVAPALLREALRAAFNETADGFFYPPRFQIGQSLYQSQVVAHALAVPGVQRVACQLRPSPEAEPQEEIRVPQTAVLRLLAPVSIEVRHAQ
ncbi:MAG: hypothetical protein IPM39_19725 [Chloroflexi bacterium]|nr:hypothetical protein [Chloroflexota bacterium]